MDSHGTTAVAVAYHTEHGYRGGIAFLDAAGKQVRFIETDRFMPLDLCFDSNDYLWAFGWQRDAEDPVLEDRTDYFTVRKFGTDRRGAGRYLLRSQFDPKRHPFRGYAGGWRARPAAGKIGVIVQDGSRRALWELDFSGNVVARWPLGEHAGDSLAYTNAGSLFAKWWDRESGAPRVSAFDRNLGAWVAARHPEPEDVADFALGMLLGSDGEQPVFTDAKGYRLLWAEP